MTLLIKLLHWIKDIISTLSEENPDDEPSFKVTGFCSKEPLLPKFSFFLPVQKKRVISLERWPIWTRQYKQDIKSHSN